MNEGTVNSGSSSLAVDEVISLLDREISCTDAFLALLEEERQALLKMDVTALMGISRKKTRQLERLQQLDRSMEERVQSLLKRQAAFSDQAKKGDNGKIVRLSAIAELCPGEHKKKLCQGRDQLAARRSAIADKNYINKRLVEDSLGYLNDAISLLTGAGRKPVYGRKAGNNRNKNQPALISRAV